MQDVANRAATGGATASPDAGRGDTSSRAKETTGSLACGRGVTVRAHGLDVSPSLTPSVTLAWQGRPAGVLAGRAGALPARGGLRLFQFTLSGTITLNLGVSVSGAARCQLTLPAVIRTVTAGGLGTVRLRLRRSAAGHHRRTRRPPR